MVNTGLSDLSYCHLFNLLLLFFSFSVYVLCSTSFTVGLRLIFVFLSHQLCAISTIGIAASGLALGRVDQASPKFGRFRRSTLPLNETPPDSTYATDSSVSGVHHPEPSDPRDAGKTGAPSGPQEEQHPASRRRRSSLFAPVRLRRRGQTFTNPPAPVAEKEPQVSHTRRLSSSWLRRISVGPNQPDSRVTTPSPLSPCFNGPASPGISRPSSQRRPPNKLVKRPPSEQSNAQPLLGRPSLTGVASPTFRRPATSYQRTETRHRATHSLNFEPSFTANASVQPSTPDIPESASDGSPWRPYLMSTIDGLQERLARKLSTAASSRDHGLRRIIPSENTVPALVLATSITNKQPTATEATLDQCTTPTTPATPASPPVQFRDPFTSIDASTERPDTSCPPERRSRQPSVSFDEADPKAPAESSTVTDAGRPRGSSLTYAKRRAVSTPLPKLERTNPEALFPHGKRNVTDPADFGRATGIMGSRQSILPPAMSRDFRAEMGALGDAVHRPLTSDPLALSSLQNGSSRQLDSNSSIRQRPRRHSVAASDPASTVIGSDDTRVFTSGDEDETDFLSDTAFDSIRTHLTTGSKSNPHGPRIETIFDNESPERLPNDGLVKLEDLVHRGTFVSQPPGTDPCVPAPNTSRIPQDVRGTCDSDSARLSLISDFSDDDVRSLVAGLPGEPNGPLLPSNRLASPGREDGLYSLDSFRTRNVFEMRNSESLYETENPNASKETLDSLPKMNIFDWSEKPNDREVPGSDPRPRTVHGKQGAEIRGSRAPGRKAPTTLHLRSQSVPVSRDPSLSSESRQSSGKFGTWGLGSKGVSEDWDNDFEFDDGEDDGSIGGNLGPNNNISRHGMTVPRSIMDRQASLHGQFGQVQELTLLVEELKRLRHQASVLDLVHRPSSELWKEAEGIVNLATVDEEENNHSPPRSPSSLTFSFDDSEEESSNLNEPSKRMSGDSWPASISEESCSKNNSNNNTHNNDNNTSPGPPCKNSSSAKAKSVLDMIYQKRDSTYSDTHHPRSKKLPFDTQSLHDLVIRAGVVTRSLKEVIRKAEGVTTTPEKDIVPSDPPFSRIFHQPSTNDDDTFSDF